VFDSANPAEIRLAIAQEAARLVADEGLDYQQANQKAVHRVSPGKAGRNLLPDNQQIDEALAQHLALFDEEHPQRLVAMRACALSLLQEFEGFNAFVSGAAWKGLASQYAVIQLELFPDDPKEVHYHLLNQSEDFETVEPAGALEAFAFERDGFDVVLGLFDPRQQHQRSAERGNYKALLAKINQGIPV
jgi:hypothetical protein